MLVSVAEPFEGDSAAMALSIDDLLRRAVETQSVATFT